MKKIHLSKQYLFALLCMLFFARESLAQPFVISGKNYIPCSPSEGVTALFTNAAGAATTNKYSNFVLLTVSGTGQSFGTLINDAFYHTIPGSPTHSPNYWQLVTTIQNTVQFNPDDDAYLHIVYDVDAGVNVSPGYTPPYHSNNTYTFIINMNTLVPAPVGPSILRLGAGDEIYTDNSGSYKISVTQLCPDTDKDGIPDVKDNCPLVSNANQTNTDGDALGNV
ncbi:MAG: thrombospondin type 3 repeat-containing protein, partial [Chitinophagaceae bacterium]